MRRRTKFCHGAHVNVVLVFGVFRLYKRTESCFVPVASPPHAVNAMIIERIFFSSCIRITFECNFCIEQFSIQFSFYVRCSKWQHVKHNFCLASNVFYIYIHFDLTFLEVSFWILFTPFWACVIFAQCTSSCIFMYECVR